MFLKREPKRGDVITYNKEVMFKGHEKTKAKVVVAVKGKVLLDNGDMLPYFVL